MNIRLEDKTRLEAIRKKHGLKNSCYSFNTLYIWQQYYKNDVFIEDDAFYVRSQRDGENNWFFPCANEECVKKFIDAHIDEPDFRLCNLDNDMVDFLNENYRDMFLIERKPDEDMYILNIKEHMELEGGAFRHLRKKFNNFKKHKNSIVRVDKNNQQIAKSLLFQWREQRPDGLDKLLYDPAEDIIIQEYQALEIDMYIIYVDDEACGLVGGYKSWDDCIDVCIAKRLSKARGVNYGMENLFLAQYKNKYIYADIEEDLGIENLRKSKEDLKPSFMVEISAATRR